jgi:phosphoribosylformimino-5-aminoimidazole carboxamide ribonucleotide (ProFAR) isomerase
VAGEGWTEQTDIPATSVLETLGRRGVRRFVYSSIERDGMLGGPDLEEVTAIAQTVRGTFVYSGGVASLEDLAALVGLRQVNLVGVIVGTALYEGRLDVAAGQAALAGAAGED